MNFTSPINNSGLFSDCILCKAAMLNDECQFHKIGYNLIKDTPILSKARTSIPTCLTLQPTSTFEYNAYLGQSMIIKVLRDKDNVKAIKMKKLIKYLVVDEHLEFSCTTVNIFSVLSLKFAAL